MSIHTILSQMEDQVFGHGEEVIEISIYRKDGKILSIPYNQVKTGLEAFATRIVEETANDICLLIDHLESTQEKSVGTTLEEWKEYKRIRNTIRDRYSGTKLQKMKEI